MNDELARLPLCSEMPPCTVTNETGDLTLPVPPLPLAARRATDDDGIEWMIIDYLDGDLIHQRCRIPATNWTTT